MISVIVAIYNIETYLPKCLASLSGQSFKDVEFLLADDGSTDKSGIIADDYKQDPRFKVFHTSNNGLSAARNFGMEKSSGDWLMFVDGDDWVDADFCRIPYETAQKNKADLVIFQSISVRNRKVFRKNRNSPVGIVDVESALIYGGAAWNKLYKRELFDGLQYPIGRVSGDISTTYKVVLRAKKIVMISNVLYHWVYRKDSISRSHSEDYKKDGFTAAYQRAIDLETRGLKAETYRPLLEKCALGLLIRAKPSRDRIVLQAEKVLNSIEGIPPTFLLEQKMMLMVWKVDKKLFHFICYSLRQRDFESFDSCNE